MTNNVKSAVTKAGGVTRVANQIGVSGGAVYLWIKQGRIANYDRAKKLAEMSGCNMEELRPEVHCDIA